MKYAGWLERVSGVPLKYSLPVAVGIGSLLVGGAGETTDIAYHVDFGRDKNILTAPHVLILLGIGGIAVAGLLSLLLRGPAAPGSIRVAGRTLPAGGAVILLCSGLALAAFPLDGTWHELFGEDLTLWSPTHLLLLGGPTLSILGMLVLLSQGLALGAPRPAARFALAALPGLLLFALADLASEFAFGVPQFRLLFHPLVVTFAGALALVLARSLLGRFGALKALAIYLVLAAVPLVGYAFEPERTLERGPLFLAAAIAVELVALRSWRSSLSFGAAAGLAVGTVGLAAEWAWSNVWMVFPWGAPLLPEAPLLAAALGTAAGVLGARVAAAANGRAPAPLAGRVSARLAGAGALAVLVIVLAFPLPRSGTEARATLVPFDVRDGTANVRVELDPPDAAANAEWFRVSVFHGGSTEQVDLRETGPGTYVSERSFPVGGERDASVRLARESSLAAVAVYSRGLEHGEEAAPLARRTERFETEHALPPVGGFKEDLQKVAYALVAAIAALWLFFVWRALRVLETARPAAPPARRRLTAPPEPGVPAPLP